MRNGRTGDRDPRLRNGRCLGRRPGAATGPASGIAIVDRKADHLAAARRNIPEPVTGERIEDLSGCDLVLVNTFVGSVAENVLALLSLPDFRGSVVDAGSVKAPIANAGLAQGRALQDTLGRVLDAVEAGDVEELRAVFEDGASGRGILLDEG